ncbi:MAG: hypothetical protein WBH90_15685 [Aggregatilineales bacterium]|nr:hypothetical protein [Chloroflexota bacterium]HOA22943.1 hypothetical protein [Aggregatilineales bacterium]HPV08669.1 hypothetical protein [Aggregatilineales bacterium]HQE17018.1 hypothetical protein [Aggregatilineales bacterium]
MRYDAWLIAKLHHEEMNKRAEMYRLLAEAEATAPPRPGLSRRLRQWAGTRLITLGERLADCYENQGAVRVQSARSASNTW